MSTSAAAQVRSVRSQLTEERCRALADKGYAIIDNCMGEACADALLTEMQEAFDQGLMKPNKTHFSKPGGGGVMVFQKPGIFETDMHDTALQGQLPVLTSLFEQTALVDALESRLPDVKLRRGTQGCTVKLQHNTGSGGCFPWHYDNPGRPNKRRLTCLLYLNRGWQPGDGGELTLLPFLGLAQEVAPLFDRLVVFRSDLVLHRVRPARAPRYALTVWLDGADGCVNGDRDVALHFSKADLGPGGDWLGLCDRLKASPVQRVLSRGVYQEEYQASLAECMGGAEGEGEMLAAHMAQVRAMDASAPLRHLVQRLRATRELLALQNLAT
ncbi:2OG-Fe(II) oxygenase superfamily-domain-containing protein [Tribonema minus]|uniref:2OG-Fe(II) oxygenase superfamily-domain-containing protein n=1 Tax=Tribonema minus TaxID=303371 RepID=A0A836CA70_9STRA|nr:2OG-Fe(II) oxygenase superfamily-domain-containing protein [Tribonema minus]